MLEQFLGNKSETINPENQKLGERESPNNGACSPESLQDDVLENFQEILFLSSSPGTFPSRFERKGILGAREMRAPGGREGNAGVSFPPSSRAPRVSLLPKIPFSLSLSLPFQTPAKQATVIPTFAP